ncbi:MAG: response regulator [Methanotrichaceae archaeon]|nr:response regulator [Methanotrichaceae archaeon]
MDKSDAQIREIAPHPGQSGECWSLSTRRSILIAAGLVLFYAIGQYLLRDDSFRLMVFSDLSPLITNSIAAFFLLYAGICARRNGRSEYMAWMMMAISYACWVLGDIIWCYYELYLGEEAFPSPADVPYLLIYPLFLIGILLLPSAALSSKERIKMTLDTSIVLITAVIVFWGFFISPAIEAESGVDDLTKVLAVAYPVMDLVLFFALVELLFKKMEATYQRPLLIIAASLMVVIFVDLGFMQESLQEDYVSGTLLDIGWVLGPVLAALAGAIYIDSLKKDRKMAEGSSRVRYGQYTWPLYLPYICAIGAFVLLVWSHDHPFPLSFSALSLALGGIIGLVIVRQIIALNENAQLFDEAQDELTEKKRAEEEVKRLNEGLELRVKERTSQLEIANRDLQNEISEREQAESALRESRRRLSDIIDFLPDPTFVIDRQGKVIAWNRAIENLTSIRAANILGKGDYEYAIPFYGNRRPILIDLVLNPESEYRSKYSDIKLIDDGTLVGEAYMSSLRGREAYLVGSAAALYDSHGNVNGAIESISDITERKRAEEDLRNAKENAETATIAKSKFLANMSHEIRTPMNAVIGMTGLLMQTDLKPEQREYVETIRSSGDALLSIINDILDFSKIDGGKLVLEHQPFDLISCIEQSLDLVSAKGAEKGLEITCIIENGVPARILGDASRLRQILLNLLGNAVKFTERGEVTLRVDALQEEAKKIKLHFSVEDTGIGIDREDISKLFEHFSQVTTSSKRNYGGTGLGLAISKRIVKQMGGEIWAESEPGAGSTFHFTLLAEPAAGVETRTGDEVLKGKDVLIVDDSATAKEMLLKAVQSWKMNGDAAADGREAVELSSRKHFDVVLLDAAIPDTDSLALSRAIGKKQGRPVIMLTPVGRSLPGDSLVAGWVTKPVKTHLLHQRLMDLFSPEKSDREKVPPNESFDLTKSGQASLRILLAEDNQVNQRVALSMLKKLGYQADLASNGLEVIKALEQQSYDVIFMDVQMPEMDGLEATRRIRRLGIDTCIIAMTAYAMDGDRERFLGEGMDEYISKPIRMQDLSLALKSCNQKAKKDKTPASTL